MINLKEELEKYKPIIDNEAAQADIAPDELSDLIEIVTQMQQAQKK